MLNKKYALNNKQRLTTSFYGIQLAKSLLNLTPRLFHGLGMRLIAYLSSVGSLSCVLLESIRTLQLTRAQQLHTLDSLRTLVEAIAIHRLIQLVQTHTHPLPLCSWHCKHVHGTGMLQCTLGTNNHTFLVTSTYLEKP